MGDCVCAYLCADVSVCVCVYVCVCVSARVYASLSVCVYLSPAHPVELEVGVDDRRKIVLVLLISRPANT